MNLGQQLASLFILGLPIASVAWTVTHEEVFREPREFCVGHSKTCDQLLKRKFSICSLVNIASATTSRCFSCSSRASNFCLQTGAVISSAGLLWSGSLTCI